MKTKETYSVGYEVEGNEGYNYSITVSDSFEGIVCFCNTKSDANLIKRALEQYEAKKRKK